ncbi:hypothetical protein CCUS01_02519 [Colletotrichum cuscutae]|uniref:Uncharacterized protein n=1 Tax=Colletotrichum cuscutae TaxID=1209917 RepID=A0AAJ0DQ58_9PEZI|nr:hypothetical protein CCUS01_02519 [Colletotrichum cuscutae]
MSGRNRGVKGRLRLFPSRFLPSCKKNRTIIVHAHLFSYMGEAPGVPTDFVVTFCFA